jgi:hypothetical protein
MNNVPLIPSRLRYAAAPATDQDLDITLNQTQQLMNEYARNSTVSLAQVYDDERQGCTVLRPTFKVTYLYGNEITGTTTYLPFQYNLYYVDAVESKNSNIWKGFPQFYEFDFYRSDFRDGHLDYTAKSAYTYNWTYYLSYPYENSPNQKLFTSIYSIGSWLAKDGIPFVINNTQINGNSVISFECIAPHGLILGEYVETSFSYNGGNLFEVYSLGNGLTDSNEYVFNIQNVGFTGRTFLNGTTGTFKRVINPDNLLETTSKYYVRKHKILTDLSDMVVTKTGFEKNVFLEQRKLEYSSITPNNTTRVVQKTSSNAYNFTLKYDLNLEGILDNQKRPLSQLFLTIISKGYTGYFNEPSNGIGIKQGWGFNLAKSADTWWSQTNFDSNTNIPLSSYTKTSGVTKTFFYSSDLKKDDSIDGDFCEWNDYEQLERVVSPYYQKMKFNQNVFSTTPTPNPNAPGYYYRPHLEMQIRVFSDYIETGDVENVENVPSYSYYSKTDNQFRWRDLYTYGFKDNLDRGVDYPFLNSAHYPYENAIFRLIPEGSNYNERLTGINFPVKPLVDECE